MRKYLVLTSILALAACGGGSGGHHGSIGNETTPGDITTPTDTLTAEQRAAAIASNQKLTDMESFIVIGGSNPTVNPNTRSGATKQSDGGIRYDLSDVTFKTASFLMSTGSDTRGTISFGTENGEINKIHIVDDILDSSLDRMSDSDKTNEFLGTYTIEEDGELESGQLQARYTSVAKENGLGLKYADFAILEWGEPGEFDTTYYMVGGYEAKEIKTADISNDMAFTGVAEGVVMVGNFDDDDASTHNVSAVSSLTFNGQNKTSTLQANFSDWYDVTATMDSNGNLASLKFSNGDKEGFYNDGSRTFKWDGQDEYTAKASQGGQDGEHTIVRDGFVEYYGDGKNPAEAVGVIKYGDSEINTGTRKESMTFDMGFGAKRD